MFDYILNLFISLCITSFVYLFILFPGIKKSIFIYSSIFWFILCPILLYVFNLFNFKNKRDEILASIKFASVWFGVLIKFLIILYFLYFKLGDLLKSNIYKFIVFISVLVLIINILEASIRQIYDFQNIKKENVNYLNLINGILGIVISLMIIHYVVTTKETVNVIDGGGEIYFKFNISILLILAYTFWNLQFKNFLNFEGDTLFIIMTLILPLILNYYKKGSWLQFRSQSLLIYAMLLGVYNYIIPESIKEIVKKDKFTEIQTNMYYNICLLVLCSIFIMMYVFQNFF